MRVRKRKGKKRMKVAFLGFDLLFSALEALAAEGCEILKIFTCPVDGVTEFNTRTVRFAKERGIPLTDARISRADLDSLEAAGCALVLCAGYYFRAPISARMPMVNVHPAPLPACRGAWPMPQILLGAYPHGGVTVHRMAADFDTGDILLQEDFPISESDTLDDYMAKANALVPPLVRHLVRHLPDCLKNAKPQGAGRYLAAPTAEDMTVKSGMTVSEADRILRAFYGHECRYEGKEGVCTVLGARAVKNRETPNALPLSDGWVVAKQVRKEDF